MALRPIGENGGQRGKAIGIVGCDTSNVRSRVAGDIAIEAAASRTESVLLIDADTGHQRVVERFHVNRSPGWRDVLAGRAAARDCVQQSELTNLAVMGPGETIAQSPGAESLGRLDDVKNDYGLVIVDLPPTSEAEEAPAFDAWIDEAVLVVEAERTRVQVARRSRDMLSLAGIRVAGIVLANRREYIPRWLYQRL